MDRYKAPASNAHITLFEVEDQMGNAALVEASVAAALADLRDGHPHAHRARRVARRTDPTEF